MPDDLFPDSTLTLAAALDDLDRSMRWVPNRRTTLAIALVEFIGVERAEDALHGPREAIAWAEKRGVNSTALCQLLTAPEITRDQIAAAQAILLRLQLLPAETTTPTGDTPETGRLTPGSDSAQGVGTDVDGNVAGKVTVVFPTDSPAPAGSSVEGKGTSGKSEADEGGTGAVTPAKPMTRAEAHKLAQAYVEKHDWPASLRKLADAVGVSRPLLDDLPGSEQYKRVPAPKAATQQEQEEAREAVSEDGGADPAETLAYDEQRKIVKGCMDEAQRKGFDRLGDETQRAIVERWDEWEPAKRKKILEQCGRQEADKAEVERPAYTARRGQV